MKRKNNSDKDIKRRLTVIFAAAVFVFGTCFYPVTYISATEDNDLESIENITETEANDAVNNEDMTEPYEPDEDINLSTEEEETRQPQEAVDTEEIEMGGTGYRSISEIRERIALDEGETPEYFGKKSKKLRASFEPKYLPQDQEYYRGHVDILDQGDTDACWAYTASTAAQISYLKELYDTSSIDRDYDLSPTDFAYFFYNRQHYPYGKSYSFGYTSKDKNRVSDYNKKYHEDEAYLYNGGNNYLSAQAMANWMGMHEVANESTSAGNAYNNSIVLENALYLNDKIKRIDGHKYYVLDENLIKGAVKKYGALAAEIFMDYNYRVESEDEDFMSSYCNYKYELPKSKGETNHAVTIVGWDDTFSSSNFPEWNQPERDGAWIVQNSWGTDDFCGDGFVYVSYDDLSLQGAVAYDMQPADKYDANYHYDGNAYPGMLQANINSQFANVYTVPDDGKRHTLKAVGFTTWNELNTTYRIKIYRSVKTTPTSGKLVGSAEVSTDYAGNYTFDFSDYGIDPVYLYTGEKFAVLVQPLSSKETDEDGTPVFYMGMEKTRSYSWIKFESSTGSSKRCYSRTSSSKSWNDAYSSNKSLSYRIKAFTNTTDRISVSNAKVTLKYSNYSYKGKLIKPVPTVTYNGKKLTKGTHYTVTYSKNKYPGTAKITIKGKGLYKGTVSKGFTIAKVQNFRQTSATTKTITLKWKKSSNMKGYKIYRYTSGKYKLIKTITKNSKLSFTDKNRKVDTGYKYKIRSYKKIGKKTYYGPYSSVLNARTKAKVQPTTEKSTNEQSADESQADEQQP